MGTQSTNISARNSFYYDSSYWNHIFGTVDPISELKSKESDLIFVFVTLHGTRFREPVDDLLYSAHKPLTKLQTGNRTVTSYQADDPLAAFACQNQVGVPETPRISVSKLGSINFVFHNRMVPINVLALWVCHQSSQVWLSQAQTKTRWPSCEPWCRHFSGMMRP